MKYLRELISEMKQDDWKDDDLRHIQTKDDISESQKLNFNKFYREVLAKRDVKHGAKLLADATPYTFTRDMIKTGSTSLVGHTVDSPEAVAKLAQIYRDPRTETLHMIYTKGNEVVSHGAVSSRLPAAVIPFKHIPHDENMSFRERQDLLHKRDMDIFHDIHEHMKNVGADGFYMLHNHPTGNPTPSNSDVSLTRFFSERIPGFQGHIVIDHNAYAHITKDLQVHDSIPIENSHIYDVENANQHHVPSDLIGKTIGSQNDAIGIAKTLEHPNHVVMIGRKASGKVGAIASFPADMMDVNDPRSVPRIKRFKESTGSSHVILASNSTHFDKIKGHHTNGHALDVVNYENGNSQNDMGSVRYEPIPKTYGGVVPVKTS